MKTVLRGFLSIGIVAKNGIFILDGSELSNPRL
jgi:hypothetical protein